MLGSIISISMCFDPLLYCCFHILSSFHLEEESCINSSNWRFQCDQQKTGWGANDPKHLRSLALWSAAFEPLNTKECGLATKLLLGRFFQEVHDQLSFRIWQSAKFSHNCLSVKAGCTMRACWWWCEACCERTVRVSQVPQPTLIDCQVSWRIWLS